jgi:zinc protease
MSATLGAGLSPVRAELANGAVVTVQETSMTPAVTISAAFRAGAVLDPADREGLSYLTGRVLDRGTSLRSAAAIAEQLDERGVSLKVSTSRHALTLSCTCLSEDFDDVLAIVADVSRRAAFQDDEVEKQRLEAVSRLRQDEDNPALRAADGTLELLYTRSHPYGRPVKGTASAVERMTQQELVGFHDSFVVPATLSLVVVGDVPAERVVERAAIEFGGWDGPAPPPSEVQHSPPRVVRRRRVISMPGKSQADIVYGFTGVRRLDPRFHAYWMMNNVLGQFGLGGRLADNIRERQGMAYYAFSTLDTLAGEAPLLVRAGVDPADVDRAVAAIDHEVARLAAEGPTPVELEETRASLIGSIPRTLETNQGIAAFLQTVAEFGLGLDYDRRLPSLLRRVTLEEVCAAAAEVLDPARAAVVIAGPLEAEG